MAIPEAEVRRVVIKWCLLSLPLAIVGIMLVISFGEGLISLAEDWPGGPTSFMVTLGAVNALLLLLVATTGIFWATPERTPPRLRMSPRPRIALTVASDLAFMLTIVPLISATPGRRADKPSSCDDSSFRCVMLVEHSGAGNWGFYTFLLTLALGTALLVWLFRQTQDKK